MTEKNRDYNHNNSHELHKKELEIPAIERKHKSDAQRKLSVKMKDRVLAGGVYSPLNPIKQSDLRGFGMPNIPLPEDEIKQPDPNTRFSGNIKKLRTVARF